MSHPASNLAPVVAVWGVEGPWNPWRALRAREHLLFDRHPVAAETGGGAIVAFDDGVSVVIVDPALGRRERNAVLAHELIHDELGVDAEVDMPGTWDVVTDRQEKAIDDEVARRLVPLEQLIPWAVRLVAAGEVVESWMVADRFDVPERVARLAIKLAGAEAAVARLEAEVAALEEHGNGP